MSILSSQEFARRIAAAQDAVRKNNLDAILVFSTESEPAAVRYFSDYWPSFETTAVMVPAEGDPALIIGPESLTYATARSKIPEIIQMMDFRESSQPNYPGSTLPNWNDLVKRFKLKKIGIHNWFLFPYTMMVSLAEAMGGMQNIVPADDMIRPIFMKKSAEEIACIKADRKSVV